MATQATQAEMAAEGAQAEMADAAKTNEQATEDNRPELERLRWSLSEANRKAGADRKKLEALERAEQERKDAQLSEAERLKKQTADQEARLSAASSELKAERVGRAVEVVSLSEGIIDPEDATLHIKASDIEFDDDGRPEPKSVKKAVRDLKERKPHLFKPASADDLRRLGSPAPAPQRPRPGIDDAAAAERASARIHADRYTRL